MALIDDMKVDMDTILSEFSVTVNIETPSESKDAGKATIRTWAVKHESVKGHLRPLTGSEEIKWNRPTVTRSHLLYVKPAAITEVDRVAYDSRVFDIVFVEDPQDLGHHYVLHLLERPDDSAAGGAGYGGGGYGE